MKNKILYELNPVNDFKDRRENFPDNLFGAIKSAVRGGIIGALIGGGIKLVYNYFVPEATENEPFTYLIQHTPRRLVLDSFALLGISVDLAQYTFRSWLNMKPKE